MTDNTTAQTQRGKAFERLLLTLAAISPSRPSREALIESTHLSAAHSSRQTLLDSLMHKTPLPENELSDIKRRNATKALGRAISNGIFHEVIIPNGKNDKVQLPETGLIAISISLTELNTQHEIWKSNGEKGTEPTQESLAETIKEKTVIWAIENSKENTIPVFLKDIWVVHGSGTFDMLVLVMYNRSADFMAYVRQVLQRTKGVHSTQTMQISNSLHTW